MFDRVMFIDDVGRSPLALSQADLSELRAAARPEGLRLRPLEDPTGERLKRLDRLNSRRLLRFGGLRPRENSPCEVVYALTESGLAAFRLH